MEEFLKIDKNDPISIGCEPTPPLMFRISKLEDQVKTQKGQIRELQKHLRLLQAIVWHLDWADGRTDGIIHSSYSKMKIQKGENEQGCRLRDSVNSVAPDWDNVENFELIEVDSEDEKETEHQ